MKLNPLWDLLFAITVLTIGYWYYTEKPSSKLLPRWRQNLFYLALTLIFFVLVGPVPHLAVRLFWVHMVQHILLMMLISPLIVLGSPFFLVLNSSRPRVQNFFRRLASFKILRALFKPHIGFAIFLVTLIATHFGPLANAGMVNSNVHCGELILFLFSGVIYYYPVLDGNPAPYPVSYSTRLGSLFAMMLPETMTGFFLYSGNKLLHTAPMRMGGLDPLHDQHTGGALMWAMGMLIDSMWVVLAARDWFANEKRLSDSEDEETAQGRL
ncbi:MAG: cytochrome c oxidase assembly protein [Actinomycetes bacterium]